MRTISIALFLCCVATPALCDDVAAADAAFAGGRLEEAEARYKKLVAASTGVAHVYSNLAILYDDSHRGGAYTEQAEVLYRRAIELDPKLGVALFRYALHEHGEGRGREAIPLLRRAAAIDGGHAAMANYWLARLLQSYGEGSPGEFEKLMRKSIALDARNPAPFFYLGRYLANNGRKAEAIAVLQQGAKLPEGDQPFDFEETIEEIRND